MKREGGKRSGISREGQRQHPEGRLAHHRANGGGAGEGEALRRDPLGEIGPRIDDRPIEPGAQDKIDGAEHHQRAAPAAAVHQDLHQRNKHGGSKAAPQCQSGDAGPCATRSAAPGNHREGGLVERRRLQHADPRGEEIEDAERLHLRPAEQAQSGQDRSRPHDDAAMAAIDRRADRIGGKAREHQAQGRRAIDLRLRPAEIAPHGLGDQGKAVIERAPGTDLADAQPGNEQAAPAQRRESGRAFREFAHGQQSDFGASAFTIRSESIRQRVTSIQASTATLKASRPLAVSV